MDRSTARPVAEMVFVAPFCRMRSPFLVTAAEGDYSGNTCTDNKYGIRWSVGAAYNKVYDNEVYNSEQCESSNMPVMFVFSFRQIKASPRPTALMIIDGDAWMGSIESSGADDGWRWIYQCPRTSNTTRFFLSAPPSTERFNSNRRFLCYVAFWSPLSCQFSVSFPHILR